MPQIDTTRIFQGAFDRSIRDAVVEQLNTLADAVTALEVAPVAHAASHQADGDDEIATATAAAGAIPKADGTGTLDAAWIPPTIPVLVAAPAAADSAGTAGQIAYDGDYLYVCVDTNTWLQVAIATWGGE